MSENKDELIDSAQFTSEEDIQLLNDNDKINDVTDEGSEDDVSLMITTGNYIMELEKNIEELGNSIAESFYSTIRLLSDLVCLIERSYYEGSHSRFVSQKSVLVAELLNMSHTDIFEIQTAGLLHDIGKIGFNTKLLAKFSNEMTPNELEFYKNHSKVGYQILSNHSGFSGIAKIIIQHHERLDGSGFPYKLEGKEILPGAAILGVVDTFHVLVFKRSKAMIENLSYSDTMNYLDKRLTNAIEYLNVKATTLFDSKVVDVFCKLMKAEWGELIKKTIWRVHITKLEEDMIIAEDYFNSAGLLIAAKGEHLSKNMIKMIKRFAESGEISHKILIMT